MWKFLGFFQTPVLRRIHAFIVALVFMQIVSSQFMGLVTFAQNPLAFLSSNYHIVAGLFTTVLAIWMTVYSFSQRGLRRYFPYLWGDTAQIVGDIKGSMQGKLPAPKPGGLATAVQGLGFGALLLAVLSGLTWFVLRSEGASPDTVSMVLHFHKIVVKLLVLYFVGHGGMALLHFVLWQRKIK